MVCWPLYLAAMTLACLAHLPSAMDNGLARTPPRGFRSWNEFGPNINQNIMQEVMTAMVSRKRSVNGVPTSLADLGYTDAGVDDAWQECHAGVNGGYHRADGSPIVNATRFPSLKAMTGFAHSLNLTAGFYGNNCEVSTR